MTSNHLQAGDLITPTVRLVRPLAEGGMGRVWVAEHLGLQAEVVVKLMAPEIAARPDGAERFAREAAVAAAIKSPHVVQVFDHGVTEAGTPYIVMELLEGRDLGVHLAASPGGRMAPTDVVTLVCQIGKALSKAHRASIIHRDIKPENIFVCDTGENGEIFVKLLDFGTARRDIDARSRTTVPGQIMGTPYYMSPEQSVGSAELDARTDIWSLGVVAFEALTGQRPFEGSSVGAIAVALRGPTPKMTSVAPDLPEALDDWFARACAQEPRDRFATVREAMSALVEAVTGTPPLDWLTESIHFPAPLDLPEPIAGAAPATAITSVAPMSTPIKPLVATLPAAGSERRFTTIAAGVVMAAAAVAMAAIVLGRSPAEAPSAPRAASPAPEAPAAEAPADPAIAPPATPTAVAAERHDSPPPSTPAAVAAERHDSPPPKPAALPPAMTRDARMKSTKAPPPHRGRAPAAAAKDGLDDDLVRLTNATSKPVEAPAVPPPASPPAGSPPSAPSPPPVPFTPPSE